MSRVGQISRKGEVEGIVDGGIAFGYLPKAILRQLPDHLRSLVDGKGKQCAHETAAEDGENVACLASRIATGLSIRDEATGVAKLENAGKIKREQKGMRGQKQENNAKDGRGRGRDAGSSENSRRREPKKKKPPSPLDPRRMLPLGVDGECMLADVGVNLTHKTFSKNMDEVIQRAVRCGVVRMMVTGTSVKSSRAALKLCRLKNADWTPKGLPTLLSCTAGIHPHDAKTAGADAEARLRDLLSDPLCVAVGECGLDFNRNFSPRDVQVAVFDLQVGLAKELGLPMFVHCREAHADLLKVLDKHGANAPDFPPVCVHCFTGTEEEAKDLISRGFSIGLTGCVCRKERGAHLREILRSGTIPLESLVLETDAPFMFPGENRDKRGPCEPAHVIAVAKTVADCLTLPLNERVSGKFTVEEVCARTLRNSIELFGLGWDGVPNLGFAEEGENFEEDDNDDGTRADEKERNVESRARTDRNDSEQK
jgi:TatD DNase family protein